MKLGRSQKALRCHFELPRVEINRRYRWPLSFYALFIGPYLKHSICRIVFSLLCLSVCSSFSSTCRRIILSIGQSVLSVYVPTVPGCPCLFPRFVTLSLTGPDRCRPCIGAALVSEVYCGVRIVSYHTGHCLLTAISTNWSHCAQGDPGLTDGLSVQTL